MSINNQKRDYYWYLGRHLIIFLVLTVLNQNIDDTRGWTAYNLIKRIKLASDGKIKLRVGTLYPLIQKIEQSGLVKKDIEIQKTRSTGTHRERAVYSLTKHGKDELLEMRKEWNEIQEIISQLAKMKL